MAKKITSPVMRKAYESAGYREKYAMERGNKTTRFDNRGHKLWVFTYSKYTEYQDANGATYDVTEGRWVN